MEELLISLITLPFIKKKGEASDSGSAASSNSEKTCNCAEEKEELSDCKLKAELYKAILLRYQGLIEQGESKSIAELKGMIRPEEKPVLEMREAITTTCHPYIYEEKFSDAFSMALSRVCILKTVKLPIEFWLSNDFSEMLSLGAGDEMDKAILLCSLLRSLGNPDVWVLVTSARKSYVLVGSVGGETTAVDVDVCERTTAPTREQVLKALSEKSKLLYAFNDKEYEEYSEL